MRKSTVVVVNALVVALVVGVIGTLPNDGESVTSPISGAVPKPAGFDVRLPFESGERVEIVAGYSPSAGSNLHNYTNRTGGANDYYALDLVLPDHSNNGLGQPVLATASGTVVKAGWATSGWANYGLRVIIRHDFSDGHTYHSMYAHLDQLDVAEGDTIGQGTQIGTLGDSCEGDSQNRSCPWFNPHLHFVIHRDSSIGGSGTGGSYGGNAVVPEPLSGHEDLTRGDVILSDNSGGPVQPCQLIEGAETIIDNDSRCFSRRGPSQYWHEESTGHGGDSTWTYTIDQGQPDNYVYWNLHFGNAGTYDLWAWIPAQYGEAQQARYKIRHSGAEDLAQRSQASSPDGWLHLGQYAFAAGDDQWVLLEDNTGEPYTDANGTTIVFDALRVRPASDDGGNNDQPACTCSDEPPQTEACGMCGTRTRSCDGCNWTAWSACTGEGVCSAGSIEEEDCTSGGARQRTCDDQCQFGGWSTCSGDPANNDPDPTNNDPDPTNNDPSNNDGDPANNDADPANNDGGGSADICGDASIPLGDNGATCDGVPDNTWRCACSERFGATVSQVCRGGEWINYQLRPSDCGACDGSFSGGCEPPQKAGADDSPDWDDAIGDSPDGDAAPGPATSKGTCAQAGSPTNAPLSLPALLFGVAVVVGVGVRKR